MGLRLNTRELIDYEDYAGTTTWLRLVNNTLTGLAILSIMGASAILIAYLIFALEWRSRPFLGVLFSSPLLEIEDATSFGDERWVGRQYGLEPGDTVVSFYGVTLPDDNRPATLDAALDELFPGATVNLRYIPDQDHTSRNRDCNERGCQLFFPLQKMSTMDFVLYFGSSYAFGVLILMIGVVTLIRRPDTRATRLFAISAAALSVYLAGRFDIVTSFKLTEAWFVANFVFAGALLSFALSFPYDLGVIRRLPAVRYAPLLGVVVLSVLTAVFYEPQNFNTFYRIALATQIFSVAALVAIMIWRRSYSKSPIIREQVIFVGLGAFVGFMPTFIWSVIFVGSGGEQVLHEALPVVYAALILYALSFAYATLQYRLLATDRIIPEAVVYGVLTTLLLVGYFLVTLGLSVLGIKTLSATSPILVAMTIGVVVLFFNPVRSYLRHLIDRAMHRRATNYQDRSESFARSLTNAVNMGDVFARLKHEVDETVAPEWVFMFVHDIQLNLYTALPLPGQRISPTDVNFEPDSGLVKYLQGEQSVLYLEPGQPLPVQVAPDRARLGILGTPLLLSLRGSDKLNGILAFGPRKNQQGYGYEDLRFLENLVDQAALSVERARFVDNLEQQVLYQEVISKVSSALGFAIDFETLLELVYNQTSRVVKADHFYVVSYDAQTTDLHHSFYIIGDDRIENIERYRWKAGDGVIAEVIKKQAPVRVAHFTEEQERRNPDYRQPGGDKAIHAWIGAPMLSDSGGVFGVMAVGSSDPRVHFSADQEKLIRDIANVTASALDKSRLFQKTQLRANQLKALTDISNQLAAELENVDKLLENITQNAVEILGCEAGSLLLLDENKEDLIFRVVTGGSGQNLINKRISRREPSLVANAVNRIEPIVVNNPEEDARWHGEIETKTPRTESQQFHSRTLLTVPLVAQGEAVGALQLINKRGGINFDQEDADMATTFAGQAAIAIQNARLFESQDQQLLVQVQELQTMTRIDRELNQTVILDELVKIIMGIALNQTHATHGALLLLTEDGEDLQLIGSFGYPEESFFYKKTDAAVLIPPHIGIQGRVLSSGKPAAIRVSDNDPGYVESLPGCTFQIAVPIIVGADTRGVVIVETLEERPLGLLEQDFLSRLVDRASSAISNAILYSRLEQQQEARAKFVRFVAHELKAPLTAMKGYSGLLQRGVVGELNSQQANFLSIVHRNIDHMEHLVDDIRDIEIMGATGKIPMQMKLVDFSAVLDQAMQTVQQGFEDKEQTVLANVPEDLPQIWADERRLVQIMTNFLTNANKYTPAEGEVQVLAEAVENIWDEDGARRVLHIAVKDNGLGISEEDQQRLFEQYFRSTNELALNEKGTGLGLTLTRSLIIQHGGTIWFESALGAGTTFHFTIPLASEVVVASA